MVLSIKDFKKNPIYKKLSTNTHLKELAIRRAGSCEFLIIETSFITGADISVDGGWTAW